MPISEEVRIGVIRVDILIEYLKRKLTKPVDFVKGFHFVPMNGNPYIGRVYEYQFKDGQIGLLEVVNAIHCGNPYDAMERVDYSFKGFDGKPEIKACTYKEFKTTYFKYIEELKQILKK